MTKNVRILKLIEELEEPLRTAMVSIAEETMAVVDAQHQIFEDNPAATSYLLTHSFMYVVHFIDRDNFIMRVTKLVDNLNLLILLQELEKIRAKVIEE